MGLWTTAGLNLIATAVQTPGVNCAIAYAGISLGCGTLASPLTSGNTYTTLALNAGIPASLASGQSLTITDGTHTQTVTTSGSVSGGATSIPVTSFMASATFAATTTGVAPTPQAGDVALYAESVRVPASAGAAGGGAGESLTGCYFDGTQASGLYMMVGYFGGSTATGSTGTGTLLAEDIQVWNHTQNNDSNMYQADSTI